MFYSPTINYEKLTRHDCWCSQCGNPINKGGGHFLIKDEEEISFDPEVFCTKECAENFYYEVR
jgi:hypothetical protein